MRRHEPADIHLFRLFQRLHPFGRVAVGHRREDPIREHFAHEQDLFARQVDLEIAAGVGTPQKQHVNLGAAHRDDAPVGDRLRRLLDARRGERMSKIHHAGGEGGDAAGVVAMLRADDHVLDRLGGEPRDVGDKPSDVVDRSLALRDQHAGGGDHDQVVDGDGPLGRIDLLVRVDVVGEFGHARKISRSQAAQRDVAVRTGGLIVDGLEAVPVDQRSEEQCYRAHVNLWTRLPS